MPAPTKYSIGRSLGATKVHAFDLLWDGQRPVLLNFDPDFGPDPHEYERVIAHLSRSHRVRSGFERGGQFFETLVDTDPRTKAGFDQAVYVLGPPWVLLGGKP